MAGKRPMVEKTVTELVADAKREHEAGYPNCAFLSLCEAILKLDRDHAETERTVSDVDSRTGHLRRFG